MSIDYIVASLPALRFDEAPAWTWERFLAACADCGFDDSPDTRSPAWRELETLLRNAMAESRTGAADYARPTAGVSLFWKNRVFACFAEHDVMKRERMLDLVWWDAAGELTSPTDPLGAGALATYAVRLRLALRRARISETRGNEIFEKAIAHD